MRGWEVEGGGDNTSEKVKNQTHHERAVENGQSRGRKGKKDERGESTANQQIK